MSLLTRLAEVNGNDITVASVPSHLHLAFAQVDNIDTYLATTLSDFGVHARLSLAVLVPIYTQFDELWNHIVREGVQPTWTQSKSQTQRHRPKNHKCSDAHTAAVRRHVRKGQLEGRYLVLDDRVHELWPKVFISPVGVF
ncbi:hypothetical protein PHMEG_00034520 [Phytophthora megakarya]|uniref:Uncharacterized protein n=1 Tax=Phytophthora megakarya TaxID=4795 RepID=A0A225UR97_9STRA|nr:hypothetical protein PHMEG_00034520 [Phytophthora megakarya]